MNTVEFILIDSYLTQLGAHIAGLAGKRVKSNQKISAIIGLDPANVLFDVNETNYRLADTDAEYVQIIHTDIDGGSLALGIDQPIGHGELFDHTLLYMISKIEFTFCIKVISIRTMEKFNQVASKVSRFQ